MVRAIALLLLSTALVGLFAIPVLGQEKDPRSSEVGFSRTLYEAISAIFERVRAAGAAEATRLHQAIEGSGQQDVTGPGEAGPTRPLTKAEQDAHEALQEELRRLQGYVRHTMHLVASDLKALDEASPRAGARAAARARVRFNADTAIRLAKRIESDSAASTEQQEQARQAREQAELASLRNDMRADLEALREARSYRDEPAPERDHELASRAHRVVEIHAARASETARRLGDHPAATDEDLVEATSALIETELSQAPPAPAPEADQTAATDDVAETTGDAPATTAEGDPQGRPDQGETTQPANRAQVGFTTDSPPVAPGTIGRPGGKATDGKTDGKDDKPGKTKTADQQPTPQPGGRAQPFGDGWMTEIDQLSRLGKGNLNGDEDVVGAPERPGGIAVTGDGIVGGGPDEPAGVQPVAPGTWGVVVPSPIGGTVGIQTGDRQPLTASELDLGLNHDFFTSAPADDIVVLPELTERVIDLGPEGFGPPMVLPDSTITGAGSDVDLGAGAGTSIFTPPPAGPLDGTTDPPLSDPALHLPDSSALLG